MGQLTRAPEGCWVFAQRGRVPLCVAAHVSLASALGTRTSSCSLGQGPEGSKLCIAGRSACPSALLSSVLQQQLR